MKLIKKLWAKIRWGLAAQANSEEYVKTGRYLGDDPEFPGTYRPELNGKVKKVKTTAAVVIAATLAASAQAGLFTPAGGDSANGGGGGSFWGNVWNWISSNIGWGDVAAGLSSSGTNPPNATANDLAYAAQQAELGAAKKDK